MILIIIPTYNERENLPFAVEAIMKLSVAGIHIFVVDDNSPDGTGNVAEELAKKYPITIFHRQKKEGLGRAYRDAFRKALNTFPDATHIIQMDADLSHPPEVVPALVDALSDGADLAVGSRYVAGGGIEDWPVRRRVISRVACFIGGLLVPVRDATSGFFALRRGILDGARLNATGFKIGFEIIARARAGRVVEVPYTFRDRAAGRSKLTPREIGQYLVQLGQVARDRALRRL
jgi:dolichol-phosphate mannosyltransferase